MICVVNGCKNEQVYTGKGWCKHHYKRMWAYGTFEKTRIIGDDVARFWSHVEKTKGCWLWTGAQNGVGYGTFYVKGKHLQAHRYSYELHGNKIPKGMYIDHVLELGCTNTHCVNPDHLQVVTNRENTIRGRRVTEKVSGLPLGVTHDRGKFKANKMLNGKGRTLGRFATPEEAHIAYLEAV